MIIFFELNININILILILVSNIINVSIGIGLDCCQIGRSVAPYLLVLLF
jgi:hypothetical protein